MLRACRQRRGLTLRQLAAKAETSHATLAAYEAGRKVPGTDTFLRVLRASGHDIVVGSCVVDLEVAGRTRGEELEEVLALADLLPTRHSPTLDAPVFGRT